MSDCDVDCNCDFCDCDCSPDCDCLGCNVCCLEDCDCCEFCCDSCCRSGILFCCFWETDDSPKSRHKSEWNHNRGGCGACVPPLHRIVKEEPKLKKRSRLKKIFMFWKSKENDQEEKQTEKQLDGMELK